MIAGISFVLAPDAWRDWIALLRHDGGTQSSVLLVRIAVAALIVAWGGLTDRRWTVPLAAMLALPVVWMDSFSMLLGCVALAGTPELRAAARRRPSDQPQPAASTSDSPATA